MATPKVRTTSRGQTVIFDPKKKRNVLLTSERGEQIAKESGFSVRDLSGKSNVSFGNKDIIDPKTGQRKGFKRGAVSSNILSQEELRKERTVDAPKGKQRKTTRSDFKGGQKAGTLTPTGSQLGRASSAAGTQAGTGRTGLGTIGGQAQALGQMATPEQIEASKNRPTLPGATLGAGMLEETITGGQLVDAQMATQAGSAKLRFGEDVAASSMDQLIGETIESVADVREASEAGIARQQEAFNIQQDQARRAAGAGADALSVAAAGEGREGPTSGSQVLAQQQIRGALGERVRLFQLQRDDLNAEIVDLRNRREEAIRNKLFDVSNAIDAQIAAKELEIRQADTNYINALTSQVEQEAKIRESELNMMTTKGSTVRESLSALGIMAGELGIDQLTAMTQGTDITLPEALLLQQASVLSGKVDMAKNEVDQAKAMAELEKVMLELDNFGKSDAVQEFEYYSQLSDEGKRSFLEFQSSAVNSQLVKGEDGSIYAFDPASSTLQVLSSAGDGQVGSFENAVPPEDITSVVNSSIGKGRVTGYGSSEWSQGLDFFLEGGKGAPVSLPFSFEVTEIDEGSTGFGNRIKVKNTADGKEMWISHLDSFGNIQEGQTYTPNTVVGAQGNTGTVIDLGGGGVHLDITMPKEEGGYYSPQQVASYLGVSGQSEGTLGGMRVEDIASQVSLLPSTVSDKETVSNQITQLVERGETKLLQEYVAGVVFEDLGTTEQAAQLKRMRLVETGNELKNLMSEYEKNGGDLGIFTGSKSKIMNKIAKQPTETQEIAQMMLIALEDFGRAQTGAAIQDFENKKFEQILPTIFDGKELADAKIDAFAQAQELRVKSDLMAKLGGATYEAIYGPDIDFAAEYEAASIDPTAGVTDEELESAW